MLAAMAAKSGYTCGCEEAGRLGEDLSGGVEQILQREEEEGGVGN